MFFLSNYISSCFASCLVASGRLLAWDLCPPGCSTMHFLIVGATSTFSHTKPLPFYCSDTSLKCFYSTHPCPMQYLHFFALELLLLPLYLSDFDCKHLQAILSARAQLQIQRCTVPALLSCTDKMYLLLKCKTFFSVIHLFISYCFLRHYRSSETRSFPFDLVLMHKLQEKNNSFL